jgi:hypothetical protein
MAWWLIIIVMFIYGAIAALEFIKGNIAMGIVFTGYSFSNVGLAYLSLKG